MTAGVGGERSEGATVCGCRATNEAINVQQTYGSGEPLVFRLHRGDVLLRLMQPSLLCTRHRTVDKQAHVHTQKVN